MLVRPGVHRDGVATRSRESAVSESGRKTAGDGGRGSSGAGIRPRSRSSQRQLVPGLSAGPQEGTNPEKDPEARESRGVVVRKPETRNQKPESTIIALSFSGFWFLVSGLKHG